MCSKSVNLLPKTEWKKGANRLRFAPFVSQRRERLFLLDYHSCLFGVKVLFISVYVGGCLKVEYHSISLAISLFGCIFGCVNYTPESYEYQAQYHLCSGEPEEGRYPDRGERPYPYASEFCFPVNRVHYGLSYRCRQMGCG
nr:MAG TPA: hypothetical protein [Caudoviricetes sp.]